MSMMLSFGGSSGPPTLGDGGGGGGGGGAGVRTVAPRHLTRLKLAVTVYFSGPKKHDAMKSKQS